jgi:hypothetical protein
MWQSYTSSSESSGGSNKEEENKKEKDAGLDAAQEQLSKTCIEEDDKEDPAVTNKENNKE